MLGRFYSSLTATNKETFVAPPTSFTAVIDDIDRLNTMDNPVVTNLGDLLISTPEPKAVARERTPIPTSDETLVKHDTGAESDVEVAREFCRNCKDPLCEIARDFANGKKALKLAAFNYDQGEKRWKKLAKGFREEHNNLVASMKKDNADIYAANAAAVDLQAALSSINNGRAQQEESMDAVSGMVHVPTSTQAKRKAVGEESPAPEAPRNRGGEKGRGHKRKISRSGNAFSLGVCTPSRTVEE